MKNLKIIFTILLLTFTVSISANAQRYEVSNKEMTGTFDISEKKSGKVSEIRIATAEKIMGIPHIKIEFLTSVITGMDEEVSKNTRILSGKAPVMFDQAVFIPADMEAEECKITVHFVKDGEIEVTQEGDCGSIGERISTTGKYKKIDNKKPKFKEN